MGHNTQSNTSLVKQLVGIGCLGALAMLTIVCLLFLVVDDPQDARREALVIEMDAALEAGNVPVSDCLEAGARVFALNALIFRAREFQGGAHYNELGARGDQLRDLGDQARMVCCSARRRLIVDGIANLNTGGPPAGSTRHQALLALGTEMEAAEASLPTLASCGHEATLSTLTLGIAVTQATSAEGQSEHSWQAAARVREIDQADAELGRLLFSPEQRIAFGDACVATGYELGEAAYRSREWASAVQIYDVAAVCLSLEPAPTALPRSSADQMRRHQADAQRRVDRENHQRWDREAARLARLRGQQDRQDEAEQDQQNQEFLNCISARCRHLSEDYERAQECASQCAGGS